MKTKSTNHWLFIVLGLLFVIGVTIVFLYYYRGIICLPDVLNDKSAVGDTNRYNLMVDLMYIPGSLLLTALLFYLAGRKWGKKSTSHSEELSSLEGKLKECQSQYDELLVQTSGGKLTTKEVKANTGVIDQPESQGTQNLTDSSEKEMSDIDKQIEEKRQEMFHKEDSQSADSKEDNFQASAAKTAFGKKVVKDDLKIVEGIGPKIASILNNKGIHTWNDLALAKPDRISEYLLEEGGAAYKIHDPSTWPKQAQLAAEGKFEALKSFQDDLKGGRIVS